MEVPIPVVQSSKPIRPIAEADNLAIAAFILAWIVPLVGAIMGHVSRAQAKRIGLRPNALATWAVWLGWIFTVTSTIAITTILASAGVALNQAVKSGGYTPPAYAAPIVAQTSSPSNTSDTVAHVVFKVTGYAPSGVDITYGSDSDNRSPHGYLGVLGSGTPVPWHGSVRYDKNALYYSITAQLQGSGDIRCYVILKVTSRQYPRISESKIMASGHASGSYNICDAQA